jgi:hypothetical protein
MNTQSEVLARLLRLFPVKKIKERWEKKGNKDDLSAEIASKKPPNAIYDFAEQHAGLTKQLICVRANNDIRLSDLPDTVIPSAKWVSHNPRSSKVEYFYLLDLIYNVILQAPLENA